MVTCHQEPGIPQRGTGHGPSLPTFLSPSLSLARDGSQNDLLEMCILPCSPSAQNLLWLPGGLRRKLRLLTVVPQALTGLVPPLLQPCPHQCSPGTLQGFSLLAFLQMPSSMSPLGFCARYYFLCLETSSSSILDVPSSRKPSLTPSQAEARCHLWASLSLPGLLWVVQGQVYPPPPDYKGHDTKAGATSHHCVSPLTSPGMGTEVLRKYVLTALMPE